MKILFKIKENTKFDKITTSIGTFRKGVVHAIDSKYFDSSVMEKVTEEEMEEIRNPKAAKKTEESVKDTEEIPADKVDEVAEKVISGEIKAGDKLEDAKVEESTPKKVYSKSELYALNKAEQSAIIESMTTQTVPAKEKDRVELILKLQK